MPLDFFLGGALLLHLLDDDVRLRYFPGGERVVSRLQFDVYELIVEFSFVLLWCCLHRPWLTCSGGRGVGGGSLITG